MPPESAPPTSIPRNDRVPPYSEEAERGVLGSILLNSGRVMDLCLERQIFPESFYSPAHRTIFESMLKMGQTGLVIDQVTLGERLESAGVMERVGGAATLDRLIDSTPTIAHAEYYIEIVRQKYLLRAIIDCSRKAEQECYTSEESADQLLGRTEQSFMDITEHQHGQMASWSGAVKGTMEWVEQVLANRTGLSGVSTGFSNLDRKLQGLRPSEMIVLAARPSMGKTSLAMNIAENVALGRGSGATAEPVGVFSLEMAQQALALRMLCSHAGISATRLVSGYASAERAHGKLMHAASVLSKAPMYLDDTGGLDVLELRARARRMVKKFGIKLIVIDYLQLLNSREYASQGRQLETSSISSNLKSMAKELKLPVLVLSQLSRAPEQRDKTGRPKLSDLRDSGAIEQDADVVLMLRRPCKYESDVDFEDKTMAVVDVAKHRNGPTGEVLLNFEEDYARFRDRAVGVDDVDDFPADQNQETVPA